MDKKMNFITEVHELTEYLKQQNIKFEAELNDYQILLNYMEGHDYRLASDKEGNLYQVDIAEEEPRTESCSMDDVIDIVCEWNYELLRYTAEQLEQSTDKEEADRLGIKLSSLRSEEERLDKLFEQTKYPKELDELAIVIADGFLQRLDVVGIDQAVEELGQNIKSYAARGGGGR